MLIERTRTTLVFAILLSTGAAFAGSRPNILVAIADDWSYGHAGVYDCDWVETPTFDAIAREGTLFHRAYTPNAKCAPSRACLLTGRNPWQLEAAMNHWPHFPTKFRTYVEALGRNGYATGYTGKGWGPGKAIDPDGRPRALAGPRFDRKQVRPPAKEIASTDYAANFLDFLDQTNGRPWCFWYGALEPHRGYEYGVGARLGGKAARDIDRVPAYWPDNEIVRNDLLDYAYEVEHFDTHLGRIVAALRERGELDNTLVIVTSDHGMPFPRCKGQAYEHANHIPMAIRWPAAVGSPGAEVEEFVSISDLAPTILEAACVGHAESGMEPITGRSLTPLLRGESQPERDHTLIGKERHDVGRPNDWGYPIRGIVTDRFLYVCNYEVDRWPAGNPETGYMNCDASPTKTAVLDAFGTDAHRLWELAFGKRPAAELYDLAEDADCVKNLAADPGYAETAIALRTRMEVELLAQGDPRMRGEGDRFDAYPNGSGQSDYYHRYLSGKRPKAGWINESDYRAEQNPDRHSTE